MKTLITNATLITPTGEVPRAWLLVEDGHITCLADGRPPTADRRIDAGGRFVAPGFIDLHAQGVGGFDLWDPADGNFLEATRDLARTGTTACQASVPATEEVCRVMRPRVGRADGGARVLGLYFESPLISPERRGAIPADWVKPPSEELARRLIDWSRGILSMITLAPEQPGALPLVPLFRRTRGPLGPVVVSLGHTSATYDQAVAGFEAGITHSTHTYNAMTPLRHREPGALGAILSRPDVSAELVCDGVHLHPAAVRIAIACKGIAKTCLITDCVSGNANPVVDGAPRRPDGTIAGSILSMDRAVANVRRFAGVTLPQAVEMAALSPARVIGCDDRRGSLAPGKEADLVIFDDDVNVAATFIAGDLVWNGGLDVSGA